MTEAKTMTKCGWRGCMAESSKPFTDGWASCDPHFGMEHEWLCPQHANAYEDAVAANEQPPTSAKN